MEGIGLGEGCPEEKGTHRKKFEDLDPPQAVRSSEVKGQECGPH